MSRTDLYKSLASRWGVTPSQVESLLEDAKLFGSMPRHVHDHIDNFLRSYAAEAAYRAEQVSGDDVEDQDTDPRPPFKDGGSLMSEQLGELLQRYREKRKEPVHTVRLGGNGRRHSIEQDPGPHET